MNTIVMKKQVHFILMKILKMEVMKFCVLVGMTIIVRIISWKIIDHQKMHAFNGMLTAILQAGETAGEIVFTAKANGVKAGNIRIQTK